MLQIELIDDLHDEPRQVFLRQVVLNARWKQLRRVAVDGDKLSWHRVSFAVSAIAANFTRYAGGKSDSLLATATTAPHRIQRDKLLGSTAPRSRNGSLR